MKNLGIADVIVENPIIFLPINVGINFYMYYIYIYCAGNKI